jgi:hypothetical protein
MTSNEVVVPIILADQLEGPLYAVTPMVHGTGFSIGGGACLTAGHVAAELLARPAERSAVLGFHYEGTWIGAEVVDAEVLPADVGILKFAPKEGVVYEQPPAFQWSLAPLPIFFPVKTVGYPYGSSIIEGTLHIMSRGFQGHIVSAPPKYLPVGFKEPAFPVYELSFAAPRGLSGAPLFTGETPTVVRGLVIGNSESAMQVHRSTERVSEGEITNVYEYFEYLHLGVAVQSQHLVTLRSRILGGTILSHLHTHGLLR